MTVYDCHDLAQILDFGILRRVKDKVLAGGICQIAAGEIPLTTFDDRNQTA
jgi:hypothetical protein